jgi:hypothetical protein
MSIVDVAEVEALISPGLEAEALQGVIDREEDWLATDAVVGIGPLTGERTQTIWVQAGYADPLLLRRPTSPTAGGSGEEFAVVDGGVTLTPDQYALTGPARLERIGGSWQGPKVEVTSTPTDLQSVRRAILELCRLTLTASPFAQESTEGHSSSRSVPVEAQREAIARKLNPHRGLRTVQLGTGATHRITDR